MEPLITPKPYHSQDARLMRLVDFYQQLSAASVNTLADIYTEEAWFKDPFNEVQGQQAIQRLFSHLFDTLPDANFRITHGLAEANHGLLTWEMHFSKPGLPNPMCIRGATQVCFAEDGRVSWHRDFWDANEELFCHFPYIGFVFRALRKKLSVSA